MNGVFSGLFALEDAQKETEEMQDSKKQRHRGFLAAAAGLVVFGLSASPALAALSPIIDIRYAAMGATFDGGSSFTASAVGAAIFNGGTSGFATRFFGVDPAETADFAQGFLDTTTADVAMGMEVTNLRTVDIGGGQFVDFADGEGSFELEDTNGDKITGDFTGFWADFGFGANFSGQLRNVLLDTSGDGMWDGTSGDSWSMDFDPLIQPFGGTIFNLTIPNGLWFDDSFGLGGDPVFQNLIIKIIPAPGAAMLGLIGLGTIAWLRKRTG